MAITAAVVVFGKAKICMTIEKEKETVAQIMQGLVSVATSFIALEAASVIKDNSHKRQQRPPRIIKITRGIKQ